MRKNTWQEVMVKVLLTAISNQQQTRCKINPCSFIAINCC